ncbi:MAG: NERD domain-containing protein [Thermosediminibacteraceae bacterium]|nr:NERD domain-containing protein [Thermosediminibacteraceae bacterium]
MIIDVPRIEHGLVEKMQELLDTLPVSHPKRKFIEADLHKMLSGNSGEKDVAYHLRFWYKDDQDVVVVNNLRLEYNDRIAQIDHLVAVPSGFLVMESKSLPQKIVISEEGNWYRVK